MYESVNLNNSYFNYVGNTKDVIFYEYMDSKELFSKIKNNQLKFGDVRQKSSEKTERVAE